MLYGAAQFTEGDIVMAPNASDQSSHSHPSDNNDEEEEEKGLQDLVAQGKLIVKQDGAVLGTMKEVASVDEVVEQVRKSGDALALISALQSRVKILVCTSLFLRPDSPAHVCAINRKHHKLSHRRHPCFVGSASTHIPSLRCRRVVGIHAVENVG